MSADFFQNYLFQNILSETLSECQTVWIQIRTDLSVLIWFQTVCKGYQFDTKIAASQERVKGHTPLFSIMLIVSISYFISVDLINVLSKSLTSPVLTQKA